MDFCFCSWTLTENLMIHQLESSMQKSCSVACFLPSNSTGAAGRQSEMDQAFGIDVNIHA